jgi:hypoxanthine-DNA glycosylase
MTTPAAPPAIATAAPAARKRCFDPVVDQRTRLLVLGSLPGDQSLLRNEYYGNRQNRFWMLMSEVLGEALVPLDYAARLQALLRHGVGLWDVVAEASRPGSLDSNIRERDDNDLPALLLSFPRIATIAFNGGTANKLGMRVLGERAAGYRIVALPSSSPAYTIAYAEKSAAWTALRTALADDVAAPAAPRRAG